MLRMPLPRAGSGNRLPGAGNTVSERKAPLSQVSPFPAPLASLAQTGKLGRLGQHLQPHLLNHVIWGEMESLALASTQRRLPHKLISPFSLQDFTSIWCKLLS